MWTYTVIRKFRDLQDGNYLYSEGDTYPRKGVAPDKERLNELKSDKNKIGKPLIKAVRKKKGEK